MLIVAALLMLMMMMMMRRRRRERNVWLLMLVECRSFSRTAIMLTDETNPVYVMRIMLNINQINRLLISKFHD